MSPDTVLSLLADLRTATHRCLWAAAEASLVGSGGTGARRAARSARMSLWELHESALLAARSRRDARALADLLTAADQLGIVAGAAERLATVRLTDAPAVTRGPGARPGEGSLAAGLAHLRSATTAGVAAADAVIGSILAVELAVAAIAQPALAGVAVDMAGAAEAAARQCVAGVGDSEPVSASTLAALVEAIAAAVEELSRVTGRVPLARDAWSVGPQLVLVTDGPPRQPAVAVRGAHGWVPANPELEPGDASGWIIENAHNLDIPARCNTAKALSRDCSIA